jgi:hypothetical protein
MASPAAGIPTGERAGAGVEPAAVAGEIRREQEYASEYCPRCSARLDARSCKLICPDCGYYMSCSDFY